MATAKTHLTQVLVKARQKMPLLIAAVQDLNSVTHDPFVPNVRPDTFAHEDISKVDDTAKTMTEEEKNISMIQGALAAWGRSQVAPCSRCSFSSFCASCIVGFGDATQPFVF